MRNTGLVAAFDLDGTLLIKNSSFAFCRFLCKNGFFSRTNLLFCILTYIRHCYFGLSLYALHRLIFDRLFYGISVESLYPLLEQFIEQHLKSLWYMPALLRLEELQTSGAKCIILSNSPLFLVRAISSKIGVENVYATEYLVNENGNLSDVAHLIDGWEKKKIIQQIASKTIAFSDSHLDIPFLEAADTAVAVNPKRHLKHYAKKKGWEIL